MATRAAGGGWGNRQPAGLWSRAVSVRVRVPQRGSAPSSPSEEIREPAGDIRCPSRGTGRRRRPRRRAGHPHALVDAEGPAHARRPQPARPRARRRRAAGRRRHRRRRRRRPGGGRGAPGRDRARARVPVVQDEQHGLGARRRRGAGRRARRRRAGAAGQRRRPAAARRRRWPPWSTRTAPPATCSPCSPPRSPDPTGLGRIVRDDDGVGPRDRRGAGRHRRPSAPSARSTPASTSATRPPLRRSARPRSAPTTTRASSTSPTSSGCSSPRAPPVGGRPGRRTPTTSWAATTSASSPPAGARSTTACSTTSCAPASPWSTRRPPGSTSRPTVGRRRRPAAGHPAQGTTTVGAGAVVGPDTTLRRLRGRARARPSSARTAWARRSGPSATVGPFSYLRPGTRLARGAKVGAFVETKNVEVGEDSKVPHLSYVGDATIGAGTQHRRRDRLRQLRRRGQAPHDRRRPRPDRLGHHARGAGHGGGRRVHRGRLGDHLRRPAGGHGRRAGAPAECGRLGANAAVRARPRPRPRRRPRSGRGAGASRRTPDDEQ